MHEYFCYLCMVSTWRRGEVPVFQRYQTFSTEPWNVSNTGVLFTMVYKTSGTSYEKAKDSMMEMIKNLSEVMPYWAHVRENLDFLSRQELNEKVG